MTKFSRIVRDLLLIGVGIMALFTTPPSIREVGVTGILSGIWGVMMLGGSLASLYGVLCKKLTPEIYGCSFVGGAFTLWAVAAMLQPNPTMTSVMVALVILSGTAGQFYRVGMIIEGRVDRR